MARLPRREAGEPRGDIPFIVASMEDVTDPALRRHARLRLRDNEVSYRLWAKRLRRRERVVDGVAKSIGGSLLTSSVALLLSGHVEAWTIGLALVALFLFAIGVIFAASSEYENAAWESEADRIAAALDEVEKFNAD